MQRAWGFLNDCLFIPEVLTLPPHAMVCATMYLGARVSNDMQRLEQLGTAAAAADGEDWLTVFNVDRADLTRICHLVLASYESVALPQPSVAAVSSTTAASTTELVDLTEPDPIENGAATPDWRNFKFALSNSEHDTSAQIHA